MAISVNEFKSIANQLPTDLTVHPSRFISKMVDGEHKLILVRSINGEETETAFASGWNDFTDSAKVLNELLGLED